ncbi:hypothetical protein ACFFWE_15165 [Sphaerisporangium melleum]|uniref:hypothetical protein n=1 Tax=Sphaerisporangium melleum TaxID=321316 RepID=UPI00166733CE|nr:hypothetical protein [Sphaerisporangium melleum]
MQTGIGAPPPDPGDAKTIVRFVERMRELKAWSGLSYRQLERNAGGHGEHLSYSTLAGALSRNQLPRDELLRAFVLACGCDAKTAAEWVAARQTLAMRVLSPEPDEPGPVEPGPDGPAPDEAEAGDPEAGHPRPVGPEPGGTSPGGPVPAGHRPAPGDGVPLAGSRWERLTRRPRPKRMRPARVVPVTALLLSCGVVAATLAADRWPLGGSSGSRDPGPASPRPTATGGPAVARTPSVASGEYRIRLAHSGLCLSERADSKGRILQMPCARAYPPMTLRAEADGTHRITTVHPSEGPGCMGIRYAETTPGPFVYDDFCQSTNKGGERFRVERVTTPVRGFRIRPAHNTLCFGVPEGSRKEGAVVWQMACDARSSAQIFLLEPR